MFNSFDVILCYLLKVSRNKAQKTQKHWYIRSYIYSGLKKWYNTQRPFVTGSYIQKLTTSIFAGFVRYFWP